MGSNERRSENLEGGVDGQDHSDSVTFVDVLFAVVMSLGLTQIMTRPWFKSISEVFTSDLVFEILVILLGYSTLLLSWWGYHRSLRRRRLPEGGLGLAIFAVDILIVAGYWLLLVKFESFFLVLWVLFAIYLMYFCWDSLWWLKQRPETNPEQWRRRAVTILWTVLLGTIVFTYLAFSLCGSVPKPMDWTFVVLAHLVNILYRFHKEHLSPKPLLDLLVFKCRHKEAH